MTEPSRTVAIQTVFGYTDRLSARPGEQISLHVSCEGPSAYTAAVVRLHHGFDGSQGPGFLETIVPSTIDGKYPGSKYSCQPGSYVEIDDPGRSADPPGRIRGSRSHLPDAAAQRSIGNDRGVPDQQEFGGVPRRAPGGHRDMGRRGEDRLGSHARGRPPHVHVERRGSSTLRPTDHWRGVAQLVRVAGRGDGGAGSGPTDLFSASALHGPGRTGGPRPAFGTGDCYLHRHRLASTAPLRIGALPTEAEDRLVASAAFNGKIGASSIDRRRWRFDRSLALRPQRAARRTAARRSRRRVARTVSTAAV